MLMSTSRRVCAVAITSQGVRARRGADRRILVLGWNQLIRRHVTRFQGRSPRHAGWSVMTSRAATSRCDPLACVRAAVSTAVTCPRTQRPGHEPPLAVPSNGVPAAAGCATNLLICRIQK